MGVVNTVRCMLNDLVGVVWILRPWIIDWQDIPGTEPTTAFKGL